MPPPWTERTSCVGKTGQQRGRDRNGHIVQMHGKTVNADRPGCQRADIVPVTLLRQERVHGDVKPVFNGAGPGQREETAKRVLPTAVDGNVGAGRMTQMCRVTARYIEK